MNKRAIIQPPPAVAEPARAWRDADELLAALRIDPSSLRSPVDPASGFPMRVSAEMAARIRPTDAADPVLLQFLPTQAEQERPEGGFSALDPVGDHAAMNTAGIIRKYAGRALVMLTGACAVHCRYCFRRHMNYAEHATGPRVDAALATLAADITIREVILSGGDPLSLSTARLCGFIDALADIDHVRSIRLHSRSVVADPQRVTPALVGALRNGAKRVVVVTHVNHANEIGPAAAAALQQLRTSGATLLNQAVLLRGVNDNLAAQTALSEALFDHGVLPYYLHALDPVAGADHFAVDDATALALVRDVRDALPGYLVPRFVREHAGAPAKLPVAETARQAPPRRHVP